MNSGISDLLGLETAYNEVMDDERRGRDLTPDVINFLDSKLCKDQILQGMKQRIDEGRYQAGPLVKMADVPKDNFFIRPGARPALEDWIVYHAISKYIGLRADRRLAPNVFSSRFDHRTRKLFHWADQWLKFERVFWVSFDRGFTYVLKTDITAYFANISIERLRASIVALSDDDEETREMIDLLFNSLLRPWSEREVNKYFGLPQGINASSILANLFLAHHIDALFLRDRRFRYLRYMDDIRILAKTEVDARSALKQLIGGLRDIGLDLNEKKTGILNPSQVERELRDPRRQDLDIIQSTLNRGNRNAIGLIALPLLEDLFERSFDSSNAFGGRHLRFCLNCFVRLRDIYSGRDKSISAIGSKLIDKLESMPGSANVFARFFGVFPRDRFRRQLLKFLRSDKNIYFWQEMWVLDSLLRFRSFGASELGIIRKIGFDRDEHPLCRSKAILLLGKFGDEHERYELRRSFSQELDSLVKRAIIIATQELSVGEKSDFYSTIKRTDPGQANLVNYLRSLANPLYFDDYIPSPVSTIDEQY